jgi:DNA-directed RNA polymerase subunit beta
VLKEFKPVEAMALIGRTLDADVLDPATGATVAKRNEVVDDGAGSAPGRAGWRAVRVKPFVSRDVIYLTADEDELAPIAQASSALNAWASSRTSAPRRARPKVQI